MVFVMRKLDRVPQTLGEKLRALRRGQAVSLDMMERATHIQRRYLEALERGRYENLPEPLYTRNFIRAYTRVLNADEHYFLELYQEECGLCDLVGPMRTPRQKVKKSRFFVWNQFVKFGLLGLVAFSVIGYLGWQVQSIMAPPNVILFSPADESMTTEAMIHVEGVVEGEATVYVNGEQVVVNQDQSFETEVDLEKGLNVITIEAERRYSRRAVIERRVVFEPEEGTPRVSFAEN
ncbi:helix-turn-helix domain-containing protein [Patescibacteria group bacterium]|nr:helix-turn-helix domain-containing protein [Patescibacteria group bacterium]